MTNFNTNSTNGIAIGQVNNLDNKSAHTSIEHVEN